MTHGHKPDQSRKDFSMGFSRGKLLAYTLLLIGVAACWKPTPSPPSQPPPVTRTEYNLQTTCSGGGGLRTCVSKNATDDKLGPFDFEVEFLDDRGFSLGKTTVRNDQGLEPRGEWRFNLSGPARTRSLRFGRVIPHGAP
jgi:hypothetical protein